MLFLGIISVFMLIAGLAGAYGTTNRAYLLDKGYSELYIKAKQSYTKKSTAILLSFLIIVMYIFAFILYKITNELNSDDIIAWVIPGAIVLMIPLSLFFSVRFNKINKQLIEESGDSVLVDFNFTTLNTIFPVKIQLPLTFTIALIAIRYYEQSGWTTMVYSLLVPWLLYASNRFARYCNKESLLDSYKLTIRLLRVYDVLLLTLSIVYSIDRFEDGSEFSRIITSVAALLLLTKLIYSSSRYSLAKKMLNEGIKSSLAHY